MSYGDLYGWRRLVLPDVVDGGVGSQLMGSLVFEVLELLCEGGGDELLEAR